MSIWRGVVGGAVATVLSAGMLAGATRGFSVLTTDSARVEQIASRPIAVSAVMLIDMHRLPQTVADAGRATIVDFVYTRCPTLCGSLGGAYQRLQTEIRKRGLSSRVRLLTISFDPTWDTPERLRYYELVMHPDPAVWTVATLTDSTQLPRLLRTFGVRVIPDGNNGFVHNAALHVVDSRGRLVSIVPLVGSELDERGGASTFSNDALDDAIARALEAALRRAPNVVAAARGSPNGAPR